MTRLLLTGAVALLVITSLAACDSGGSNDDDNGNGGVQPGTFSATVQGHASASLSGTAVTTGITGQWGIVLPPGGTQTITLVTTGTGRPPEGTYVIRRSSLEDGPVQAGEFFGSVVLGGSVSYSARTGTLTLTMSTPSRVAGTFSFTATRLVGEDVTVEGSFDATNTGG